MARWRFCLDSRPPGLYKNCLLLRRGSAGAHIQSSFRISAMMMSATFLWILLTPIVQGAFVKTVTLPTKSWSRQKKVLDFSGPLLMKTVRHLQSASQILYKELEAVIVPSTVTFPDITLDQAAEVPFLKGKTLALIKGPWDTIGSECSKIQGMLPELLEPKGLALLRELLTPLGVTHHIVRVAIFGGHLVYRPSFRVILPRLLLFRDFLLSNLLFISRF
jgi:hypothetical protein